VDLEADRRPEGVAAEEAIQAIVGADARELRPQVVDDARAVEPQRAAQRGERAGRPSWPAR
jgi:hypothetical protein